MNGHLGIRENGNPQKWVKCCHGIMLAFLWLKLELWLLLERRLVDNGVRENGDVFKTAFRKVIQTPINQPLERVFPKVFIINVVHNHLAVAVMIINKQRRALTI